MEEQREQTGAPGQESLSSQTPPPETLHLGPVLDEQTNREVFGAHELAIILSRFDVGVIEQIQALPIGSRRSPKVRIRTRRGEFLLKRRAGGRDDPFRVAFAHDLMIHLAERGYPVPRLVGTRDDNNSLVQFTGRTYELFEYVEGTRYDRTAEAAAEAGAALGRLHDSLEGFESEYRPPVGTYHASREIDSKLSVIPAMVDAVSPHSDNAALTRTCDFLSKAYRQAAVRVDQAGYRAWPASVLHGDWHPGNLLFNGGRITAVLDFDSARLEPRMADVANAALQFSMQMSTSESATTWPEGLDLPLLIAVVRGYDDRVRRTLAPAELDALPWLIIEALITESVLPIAATGSFAHLDGAAFLEMIRRKVLWIGPRAAKLSEFLKDGGR
jgi:homoserine kinase type II